MAEIVLEEETGNTVRPSRPSLTQVRAIIDFIQKYPDLAHKKLRTGVTRQKIKKLWVQLANIANSLEGTLKTTKGWIKFWSDKRRSVMLKQKQIEAGKLNDTLAPTEQRIYNMCATVVQRNPNKRKRGVKTEPALSDGDSMSDLFPDREELDISGLDNERLMSTEAEQRQLGVMEKLIDVMDQQSQAMMQMAQAAHNHSKALERLAEASHIQALAVDRIASTFEGINSSFHEARNAIVSIDYTLKRCYPTPQRQNSNLFG